MTIRQLDIRVPTLSRVEGEGALELDIHDGQITELRLRIFEPPRYFEKFVEGRGHLELPDMLARICGICPAAYQLTAVQAIESAFNITVPPAAEMLRRILYCGEWLQSHALHIHLLAAPDFLGYENAIAMGAEHQELLQRGLRLQSLGNALMEWLGGRSVHPVNVCTGGLYKAPDWSRLAALRDDLEQGWLDSDALVRWTSTLDFPEVTLNVPQVSLRHPTDYPLYCGRIISSAGLDMDASEFPEHFAEFQVPHSTAMHAHLNGQPYLVGPLARMNLNLDRMPESVLAPLHNSAVRFPSGNPFHAIVVRALEIRYAIYLARTLLSEIDPASPVNVPVSVQAGVGVGATEAPRGLLWQRFEFGDDGCVKHARIVPPTSQNQACIEADLRTSLPAFGLDREADALRRHAEQIIRNYDPCISCSTHFLELRIHDDGRLRDAPGPALCSLNHPVRLIAVGSPQAPDDLAWLVLREIAGRGRLPEGDCVTLDRPGTAIAQAFRTDRCNVVMDALRTSGALRDPVWIRAEELPAAPTLSSHEVGLPEALRFLEQIQELPANTWVVGLPVGDLGDATSAELVAYLAEKFAIDSSGTEKSDQAVGWLS